MWFGCCPRERAGDFTAKRHIVGVITEGCLKDSFGDEPLDDHVARLGLDLGFAPEAIARWRDLPDPPQAAMDLEPDEDWRSSA